MSSRNVSIRYSARTENEDFEPASAEQLDQFRAVLDILVRQVKSLEDRFTEVPKRAEFESMVGRSTDHAVDRLLLSLNHSVKPMILANSQQQQPTTAQAATPARLPATDGRTILPGSAT